MNESIMNDADALQADITHRSEALTSVFAARDRLNDTIRAEREVIDELKSQRDQLRIAEMGEKTNWKYLLEADSRVAYEERSRRLQEVGFGSDGSWPDTLQHTVQFRLVKNNPGEVARAYAFVREVLPAITPRDDGAKHFTVLEARLSEAGIYTVKIDESKNSFVLDRMRYSQLKSVFKADTLKELIQFMHDEVYYEEYKPK